MRQSPVENPAIVCRINCWLMCNACPERSSCPNATTSRPTVSSLGTTVVAAFRQDRMIACRTLPRPKASPGHSTSPPRTWHRAPPMIDERSGPSAYSKRSTSTRLSRARRSERGLLGLLRPRAEKTFRPALLRLLPEWPIEKSVVVVAAVVVLVAAARRSTSEVGRSRRLAGLWARRGWPMIGSGPSWTTGIVPSA